MLCFSGLELYSRWVPLFFLFLFFLAQLGYRTLVLIYFQWLLLKSLSMRKPFNSLSIRRFWGKRGKMEAKKGESFLFSPLPPPPSKISSPLYPQEGLILRLGLHRRKMSAHALLKMTRDLFRAMSLALRQKYPRNVVEMKEAMAAFFGSDSVAISCHCKRSKIILVKVLTEV